MKIEGTPRERVKMTLDDYLRKNMEDGEAAKLKFTVAILKWINEGGGDNGRS